MFLIDTAAGPHRLRRRDQGRAVPAPNPYGEWLHAGLLDLKTLPDRVRVQPNHESVVRRQIALRLHRGGPADPAHPDGGLGRRTAGLDGHRHPGRRAVATVAAALRLLRRTLRPGDQPAAGRHPRRGRHLDGAGDGARAEPARAVRRVLPSDHAGLAGARQRRTQQDRPHQRRRRAARPAHRGAARRSTTSNAAARAWPTRSRTCGIRACEAIAKGARTLVISDRDSDHTKAPIPSLLAVSAVHHHLVRTKERTTVALVVESGDAREVHHIAMLIGFGAAAVNPYLAFESIEDLIREGELTGIEPAAAVRNYLKALGKGVMKVMSKMGISTVASYTARAGVRGDRPRRATSSTSTSPARRANSAASASTCIAEEVKLRHRRAYPENPTERVHRRLEVGGEYAFRREGELHLFTPEVVFLLQHSTRTGRYDVFAAVLRGGGPARPRRRHAARAVRVQEGRATAGAAGRGRAGRVDRHPVQHRRDELRLHLRRGPRDDGHRDEQARRPVQLAARAARTSTGSTTRCGAAPSSRWPPDGSA